MKALVAYCLAEDNHVAKLAPTGAAACLITGQTILSFFRLDGQLNCHMNRRDKWYDVVQHTDVFFIDDVSMISDDLFDTIDIKLWECTGNQQLFGGKSVILFGDPAQLPMNKRPIWQGRFLAKFDVMVLKESKRRSDPAFIALLNRARLGVLTYNDCEELRKRIVPDTDIIDPRMSDATILVPFRDLRDEFNWRFLETVPGDPKTYYARDVDPNDRVITGSTATFIRDNERLWNLYPRILQLKVGCRAMLLRNISVQDHWVNGQSEINNTNYILISILQCWVKLTYHFWFQGAYEVEDNIKTWQNLGQYHNKLAPSFRWFNLTKFCFLWLRVLRHLFCNSFDNFWPDLSMF